MLKREDIHFLVMKPTTDVLQMEEFDIEISAWTGSEPWAGMHDEHITELYPELVDELGIEELAEGCMYYKGPRTPEEMRIELFERGFNIRTTIPTIMDGYV